MNTVDTIRDFVFAFLVVLAGFATLVFCLIVVMTVLFSNGGAL